MALNRRLDAAAARKIVEIFTEVIIAPEADEEAIAIVASKKNLRLMIAGALPDPRARSLTVRSVAGGLLVQDRDGGALDEAALKVVTRRAPTPSELADLKIAWTVAKHVKSNAIVYVKDGSTAGVGAGQMSRVDSARVAALKAEEAAAAAGWPAPRTKGSVVASDAFFPFADGLLSAIAGRRDRRHPARRLGARRRGGRRGGRGRGRHGVHRNAPFPALSAVRHFQFRLERFQGLARHFRSAGAPRAAGRRARRSPSRAGGRAQAPMAYGPTRHGAELKSTPTPRQGLTHCRFQ